MVEYVDKGKAALLVERASSKADAITALKMMNAADVVPVRHGEWEWVQYDANPEIGNFHCSECRFIPAAFNMAAQHLNYCPECGARMDGDNAEGTIQKERS